MGKMCEENLKDFFEIFNAKLGEKDFKIKELAYHDYHLVADLLYNLNATNFKITIKVYYKPSNNIFKLLIVDNTEYNNLIIECFDKALSEFDSNNFKNIKVGEDINIDIYVDGSYNEKNAKVGWGFCVVKNYDIIHKENGIYPIKDNKTRQVIGEIYSFYKAILFAKENGFKNIRINYDYIGIEAWVSGRWKLKDPDLIEIITKAKEIIENSKIEIIFNKINSHQGNYFNEFVDKLAKEAAK